MSKLGLPSLFVPEGLSTHAKYINSVTTLYFFIRELGDTDSTFLTAFVSVLLHLYAGELVDFPAFFWALYLCCLSLYLFLTSSKFSFRFFFQRSDYFFLKSSEECFPFNFSRYFL